VEHRPSQAVPDNRNADPAHGVESGTQTLARALR
jgi:hypothetical protein